LIQQSSLQASLTNPIKNWWEYDAVVDNHPLQKEVYMDPARYKVIVAGRRFGKSIFILEECLKAAYSKPYSLNWIVGPSRGLVKEVFWDKLKKRIEFLQWEVYKNETNLHIKLLHNQSEIYLKSADIDLVGRGLDWVGVDEFRYIDPNKWHRELSYALMDRNGKAVFGSTPNGFDALYELYQRGVNDPNNEDYDPEWKSWTFSSLDNPTIKDIESQVASKSKTEDAKTFRQEVYASFEKTQGAVYTEFNRNIHVKKLELDYDLPICLVWDFNVDPMTTLICQVRKGIVGLPEQKRVINVLRVFSSPDMSTKGQCKLLKTYLEEINWEDRPIRIYGDATGKARDTTDSKLGGDYEIIREIFPRSYKIVPKSNGDQRVRVTAVNRMLMNAADEVGIYINNKDCYMLTRDLEMVTRKGDAIDKSMEDAGFVHTSDALGYIVLQEKYNGPMIMVI